MSTRFSLRLTMPNFHLIFSILKSISVEPVYLLIGISFNILSLTRDLGFLRVLCDRLFNVNGGSSLNNHSSFDCWDTNSLGSDLGTNGSTAWWRDAENELQQEATTISMISTIVSLVPTLIANPIISSYGDGHGRKGVMLLGLFGFILVMIPTPIMFAFPKTMPFYAMFAVTAVASFTGLMGNVFSQSSAYFADTIQDKEMLTIRMTLLHLCITVSSVSGPLITDLLLTQFGYVWSSIVAVGLSASAFIFAIFTVKPVKPSKVAEAHHQDGNAKVDQARIEMGDEKHQKSGFIRDTKEILVSVPQLLAELCWTVLKRRDGHKRAYLFAAAYIHFVGSAAEGALWGSIFHLFVQKAPLNSSKDEISFFGSMSSLIRLIGTSGGIFILKRHFHLSDTFVIVLAISSQMGRLVMTVFSTSTWMLYSSVAVGAFDSLSGPCLHAFIAKTVEPNEVGKVYGAIGLIGGFSFFYTGIGEGAIYKATIAVFPTMIFLIAAAMAASTLILALWLHIDATMRKETKHGQVEQVQ